MSSLAALSAGNARFSAYGGVLLVGNFGSPTVIIAERQLKFTVNAHPGSELGFS